MRSPWRSKTTWTLLLPGITCRYRRLTIFAPNPVRRFAASAGPVPSISNALFANAIGTGTTAGGGGSTGGGAGGAGFSGGGVKNAGSVSCCDPFAGFSFGWDQNTTPLGHDRSNRSSIPEPRSQRAIRLSRAKDF